MTIESKQLASRTSDSIQYDKPTIAKGIRNTSQINENPSIDLMIQVSALLVPPSPLNPQPPLPFEFRTSQFIFRDRLTTNEVWRYYPSCSSKSWTSIPIVRNIIFITDHECRVGQGERDSMIESAVIDSVVIHENMVSPRQTPDAHVA